MEGWWSWCAFGASNPDGCHVLCSPSATSTVRLRPCYLWLLKIPKGSHCKTSSDFHPSSSLLTHRLLLLISSPHPLDRLQPITGLYFQNDYTTMGQVLATALIGTGILAAIPILGTIFAAVAGTLGLAAYPPTRLAFIIVLPLALELKKHHD